MNSRASAGRRRWVGQLGADSACVDVQTWVRTTKATQLLTRRQPTVLAAQEIAHNVSCASARAPQSDDDQ